MPRKKKTGSSPSMDQSSFNKETTHEQLNNSTQPLPSPGNAPPPSQLPFNPFHNLSNETSNKHWYKIQSMMTNSSMRVFLKHNLESTWESIKCYEYYRVILYFNPTTKSSPNHKKSLLYKAFKDEVYPILKPHVLPVPPTPMDTEQKVGKDFNPLSPRVKKDQLVTAVLDSRPATTIPRNADIGSLLYLYREHVDKDLKIPGSSEFVRPPNVVPRDLVKDLLMEELLMSLQERVCSFHTNVTHSPCKSVHHVCDR